jgi:hypothetical protein
MNSVAAKEPHRRLGKTRRVLKPQSLRGGEPGAPGHRRKLEKRGWKAGRRRCGRPPGDGSTHDCDGPAAAGCRSRRSATAAFAWACFPGTLSPRSSGCGSAVDRPVLPCLLARYTLRDTHGDHERTTIGDRRQPFRRRGMGGLVRSRAAATAGGELQAVGDIPEAGRDA